MINPTFKIVAGRIVPTIEIVGKNNRSAMEWAGLIHMLHRGVYGAVLKTTLKENLPPELYSKVESHLNTMNVIELNDAHTPIIPKIKYDQTGL